MAIKQTKEETINVATISKGSVDIAILGTSPLVCNSMSNKVKGELLLPKGKANSAEKASRLKHDPVQEFRSSMYLLDDRSPTAVGILASSFKASISNAALDLPGSTKSQIGRLVYVEGDYVPIFGAPKLFMSVVRSADMNRTPDIRTRAIIPQWACVIRISFVEPNLKATSVVNLLSAAGITQGVGDWRPQKGKGSYGQFSIVGADDPEFAAIVASGSREAQLSAIAHPEVYDSETENLLAWFNEEADRRGLKVSA